MAPSLALFIFLVGTLLTSSASLLETKELILKESSPTKSPLTSSTFAETLSGYIAAVFYSDSLCKIPLVSDFQILNKCYQSKAKTYKFITATSSSVIEKEYTDAMCTLIANQTTTSYTDGACDRKVKLFTSSTSKFTTDIATAIIRWVNVWTVINTNHVQRCC